MPDTAPGVTKLEDYASPPFLVDSIELRFELGDDETRVRSTLAMRRAPSGAPRSELVLDGRELELLAVVLDGEPLPASRYRTDAESLVIRDPPGRFVLEIETLIRPHLNTALEGLYRSGPMYCTQCEAQGFRKITYYPDRPDVMARFTTTIVADEARYPVLLSNGNPVAAESLPDGRHSARWEDPFPKPSYLFALVAGDLACTTGRFVTGSGREVELRIYVEPHNRERCGHAMVSLERAMRWDEEVFGLEYDLDIFMIVAVDDFNMGAMENKGLNIFNSKYVLADPATATDADYEGIESVIAHEYFHNWTGNRVTCRDWFQLSLKEGLTVFRDQEFSADVRSRAVKRIADVRVLRNAQFKEDAGPMAHPVRPASYLEINNFYTMTVYNKGAEVIRMIHRILGPEGFRAGMDRYFERHDGQAVTTDDFVASMESASGADLGQFRRWYAQAGTPRIRVSDRFDADAHRYSLTLAQTCAPTPDGSPKEPFDVPVAVGLLGSDGAQLELDEAGATTRVLRLVEPASTFHFEGVDERPVASVLRGFSAPVVVEYERPDAELAFLGRTDPDPFNRYDALQEYATRVLLRSFESVRAGRELELDASFLDLVRHTVLDAHADRALLAEMLTLPSESYLAERAEAFDVDAVHQARQWLRRALADTLGEELAGVYRALSTNEPYRFDTAPAARRALRNACLGYLVERGDHASRDLALHQLRDADNMTDTISALACVCDADGSERVAALAEFESRWRDEPLVMDKWFAVQAGSRRAETLTEVERLLEHPRFDVRNPNRVRALIGTFCHQNQVRFHEATGAGYRFLADRIRVIDPRNPQIAARLAGAFSRLGRLHGARRAHARAEIERLLTDGVSRDTYEILSKTLSAAS